MIAGMENIAPAHFGPVHFDPATSRIILSVPQGHAFIDVVADGDDWVLPHAEVSADLRGSGAAKVLASGGFALVEHMGRRARLTCPFLIKMASREPHWAAYFGVVPAKD